MTETRLEFRQTRGIEELKKIENCDIKRMYRERFEKYTVHLYKDKEIPR